MRTILGAMAATLAFVFMAASPSPAGANPVLFSIPGALGAATGGAGQPWDGIYSASVDDTAENGSCAWIQAAYSGRPWHTVLTSCDTLKATGVVTVPRVNHVYFRVCGAPDFCSEARLVTDDGI
jgi:hypothetical protein